MDPFILKNLDYPRQFIHLNKDDYENDDLVSFQFDLKTIIFSYSKLAKYSECIRDKYIFRDILYYFPRELDKFKKEYQLSSENIVYFFQLLKQNFNLNEDIILTYNQCIDLLKISKYLKVRKLSDQIKKYIEDHNKEIDFIIQMIQYDINTRNETHDIEIEISTEMENLLANKIDECLLNEKFSDLPISNIYRIIEQSLMKGITNDKLFDFIKKSIKKFSVLFQFVEIQKLSEDRFEEICELYTKTDEDTSKYFIYLKCNINMIKEMNDLKTTN